MGAGLGSVVRCRISCADIPKLMDRLAQAGIILTGLNLESPVILEADVERKDLSRVKLLGEKLGAIVEEKSRKGLLWKLHDLGKRPVLLAGVAAVLLLNIWIPTRVFFVTTEGNTRIPSAKILETAAGCGIGFGASRREVRSEMMKNRLLQAMPELQWAGVNTKGCTAVISVREREEKEDTEEPEGVSSIVAVRDGVVESCTATKGTLMCVPGQAVKAGETLISGYTDCGIWIRAESAQGEVFGKTVRSLQCVIPGNYTQKGEEVDSRKKYSLVIGKKRINLLKCSGISYAGCDKMYEEYYLTLPGGLRLPLALAVETWIYREQVPVIPEQELLEHTAREYTENYLHSTMIAGAVLEARYAGSCDEDGFFLSAGYLCREMIGRIHNEEIVEQNGKSN